MKTIFIAIAIIAIGIGFYITYKSPAEKLVIQAADIESQSKIIKAEAKGFFLEAKALQVQSDNFIAKVKPLRDKVEHHLNKAEYQQLSPIYPSAYTAEQIRAKEDIRLTKENRQKNIHLTLVKQFQEKAEGFQDEAMRLQEEAYRILAKADRLQDEAKRLEVEAIRLKAQAKVLQRK